LVGGGDGVAAMADDGGQGEFTGRQLEALGRHVADGLVRCGAFLPVLLRVEDAARVLGVVPRVVRRMIARGAIPATRLGRAYVIPRDAFVRVVERRALGSQPPASRERDGDWL
jgi:excisionase family DNA binding protein